MREITCAICGTNKYAEVLYPANFSESDFNEKIFSARRLPDKIHYRILKCTKCGLIFSNPIAEESKIADLYGKSKLTYRAEIKYLKKTYGFYLKSLENLVSGKQRLLEIGCGNGFFLEEAKRLDYKEVYGIEPGREMVNSARGDIRQNIVVDIFRNGLFKENFFDLVCIFQTIDHVPQPLELLKDVHRILKKRGLVFIISHDTASISAKILGEKSPIFDLEHIYLFNKKNIGAVLTKAGFTVEKIFNIANTYPLKYWLFMMPLPQSFRNVIKRNKGGWGERELTFSAGNFAVVARKIN